MSDGANATPGVTTYTLLLVNPRAARADGTPPTEADKAEVIVASLRAAHPIRVDRRFVEDFVAGGYDRVYLLRIRVNDETILDVEVVP